MGDVKERTTTAEPETPFYRLFHHSNSVFLRYSSSTLHICPSNLSLPAFLYFCPLRWPYSRATLGNLWLDFYTGRRNPWIFENIKPNMAWHGDWGGAPLKDSGQWQIGTWVGEDLKWMEWIPLVPSSALSELIELELALLGSNVINGEFPLLLFTIPPFPIPILRTSRSTPLTSRY